MIWGGHQFCKMMSPNSRMWEPSKWVSQNAGILNLELKQWNFESEYNNEKLGRLVNIGMTRESFNIMTAWLNIAIIVENTGMTAMHEN